MKDYIEAKRRNRLRVEARLHRRYVASLKKCIVCSYAYRGIIVVHHILPIAHGGDNWSGNLVELCPNCHAVVHRIKRIFGRHYITDKQLDRSVKYQQHLDAIDEELKKAYSEEQIEVLYQIIEETYRANK